MPASLFPLGSLLALQDILDEWCLVCGQALTAPEQKQESVAAFGEEWRKLLGRFRNRPSGSMRGIGAA